MQTNGRRVDEIQWATKSSFHQFEDGGQTVGQDGNGNGNVENLPAINLFILILKIVPIFQDLGQEISFLIGAEIQRQGDPGVDQLQIRQPIQHPVGVALHDRVRVAEECRKI